MALETRTLQNPVPGEPKLGMAIEQRRARHTNTLEVHQQLDGLIKSRLHEYAQAMNVPGAEIQYCAYVNFINPATGALIPESHTLLLNRPDLESITAAGSTSTATDSFLNALRRGVPEEIDRYVIRSMPQSSSPEGPAHYGRSYTVCLDAIKYIVEHKRPDKNALPVVVRVMLQDKEVLISTIFPDRNFPTVTVSLSPLNEQALEDALDTTRRSVTDYFASSSTQA